MYPDPEWTDFNPVEMTSTVIMTGMTDQDQDHVTTDVTTIHSTTPAPDLSLERTERGTVATAGTGIRIPKMNIHRLSRRSMEMISPIQHKPTGRNTEIPTPEGGMRDLHHAPVMIAKGTGRMTTIVTGVPAETETASLSHEGETKEETAKGTGEINAGTHDK